MNWNCLWDLTCCPLAYLVFATFERGSSEYLSDSREIFRSAFRMQSKLFKLSQRDVDMPLVGASLGPSVEIEPEMHPSVCIVSYLWGVLWLVYNAWHTLTKALLLWNSKGVNWLKRQKEEVHVMWCEESNKACGLVRRTWKLGDKDNIVN